MPCSSTMPSATPFENGMYIGVNLQGILYGIELLLYFRTVRIYLARRKRPHKSDIFYAAFNTMMLTLITIWVSAPSVLAQEMWLLDRNYPGGPMVYHTAQSSDPYIIFGRSSLAILLQMTDALMVYRCRVVWGNYHVTVLPSIMWVVNLVLGIMLLWTSSKTTFFNGIAVELGLAYYSSSTFLNVVLTTMICYRLLRHARTVKDCLGGKHASPYIAIVGLVVESVLLSTLSSIAFLVSYGMKNQQTVAFSFVHPIVTCIAPQMLILRVAKGEAWQKEECVFPASIIRDPSDNGDASDPGRFDGDSSLLETSNVHQ